MKNFGKSHLFAFFKKQKFCRRKADPCSEMVSREIGVEVKMFFRDGTILITKCMVQSDQLMK